MDLKRQHLLLGNISLNKQKEKMPLNSSSKSEQYLTFFKKLYNPKAEDWQHHFSMAKTHLKLGMVGQEEGQAGGGTGKRCPPQQSHLWLS